MGTNLTKFKYDLSQNNWLVSLLSFVIRLLVFKLAFTNAFRSYFPMFSPMLFLLVKKIEILFHSVLFCPPNSSKSITNSLNFAHGSQAILCRLGRSRRQLRIYKKSDREQMSPIGPYFQLNSPNNFSANRSVDSNHCT